MARSSNVAFSDCVCVCVCCVHERVFSFNNFAAPTAALIQLIRECSMRIYNSCSISGSVQLSLYSTLLYCVVSCVQFCHFALLFAYTVLRSIFLLPLLLLLLLPLLLPLPFIVTMRCPSIIFNSLIILLIFFSIRFVCSILFTYREVHSLSLSRFFGFSFCKIHKTRVRERLSTTNVMQFQEREEKKQRGNNK